VIVVTPGLALIGPPACGSYLPLQSDVETLPPFRYYFRSAMEINICPVWLLHRLGIAEQNQRHVALLSSNVLILLLFPLLVHVPHICLVRAVFGISCPGCGITHALLAVLRFDFGAAWRANPAGILIAVVASFQVMARPIAIAIPYTARLISAISSHSSKMAVACLMLVWTARLLPGGY
jgi:hypothetical protein